MDQGQTIDLDREAAPLVGEVSTRHEPGAIMNFHLPVKVQAALSVILRRVISCKMAASWRASRICARSATVLAGDVTG